MKGKCKKKCKKAIKKNKVTFCDVQIEKVTIENGLNDTSYDGD